ncbi:biliverdin-producing heme oxygenase [Ramlibacter sp. XY19]|uniref:biliverdin-producing heme oxygenase n=1 Tax=Ramlibacter paludis TaxID=2908000 RepID=UPI0023DC55E2|nr:biliverdin-producing heme oxygenase [Ramlibacter paludis]MCG2593639.1 biliverdin-producing heme oxygenase [Ramlibacter paludis]
MKSPTAATERPALSDDTALLALRQATRERHARIDTLMDLRRMGDRARYGRILQAFHAFLAPWEQSVANALPAHRHAWLHGRSRRHFLQEDLAALALPPLAAKPAVPRLQGNAAAWGSLYVIEGSALGGQVISRALAGAGLAPGMGSSYFHGWGDDTPGMWRDFRSELRSELAAPACVETACAAACATFDALTAHLEQTLDERVTFA